MPALTPTERSRKGGRARWSNEDPAAHTAKMRARFDRRFYDAVDQDAPGLPADERDRRAAELRREYFANLGRRSAAARRARAAS